MGLSLHAGTTDFSGTRRIRDDRHGVQHAADGDRAADLLFPVNFTHVNC